MHAPARICYANPQAASTHTSTNQSAAPPSYTPNCHPLNLPISFCRYTAIRHVELVAWLHMCYVSEVTQCGICQEGLHATARQWPLYACTVPYKFHTVSLWKRNTRVTNHNAVRSQVHCHQAPHAHDYILVIKAVWKRKWPQPCNTHKTNTLCATLSICRYTGITRLTPMTILITKSAWKRKRPQPHVTHQNLTHFMQCCTPAGTQGSSASLQ